MTLKIEVGKTYLNQKGEKTTILGIDRYQRFVGTQVAQFACDSPLFLENGIRTGARGGIPGMNLVKEYREPVVLRRDVVWYRLINSTEIYCNTFEEGTALSSFVVELKRETISYTEE